MIEWIDIKERLPNVDEDVLVKNCDGVRVAYIDSQFLPKILWYNRSDSCGCCNYFDDKITHWAEINLPIENEKVIVTG